MNKGKDIVDELKALSAGANWPARQPAYQVPPGYFDQLPGRILELVHNDDNISVGDELRTISPAVAALPRHTPHSLPEGYFGTLRPILPDVNQTPPAIGATVIPIRRKKTYLKLMTAAASICAVIAVSSVFLLRDSKRNSLDAHLANISDQEIVDYLQSHADVFDRDAIFNTVSQVEALPLGTQDNNLNSEDLDQFMDNSSQSAELPHN